MFCPLVQSLLLLGYEFLLEVLDAIEGSAISFLFCLLEEFLLFLVHVDQLVQFGQFSHEGVVGVFRKVVFLFEVGDLCPNVTVFTG